jgi:TPR repeat protein
MSDERTYEERAAIARSGDIDEMNYLGVDFALGQNGLPQDFKKAMKWYRKAADLGNVKGLYNVGSCYFCGDTPDGIPDYGRAFDWLKRAADGQHGEAMFAVAEMYFAGHGVESDLQKAYYWYKRSIEYGNELTQENASEKLQSGWTRPFRRREASERRKERHNRRYAEMHREGVQSGRSATESKIGGFYFKSTGHYTGTSSPSRSAHSKSQRSASQDGSHSHANSGNVGRRRPHSKTKKSNDAGKLSSRKEASVNKSRINETWRSARLREIPETKATTAIGAMAAREEGGEACAIDL